MKVEDAVFWILVVASIGTIVWLLSGSPGMENALIMLVAFCIGQIVLLWKEFYSYKSLSRMGRKNINDKLEIIERKLDSLTKFVRK